MSRNWVRSAAVTLKAPLKISYRKNCPAMIAPDLVRVRVTVTVTVRARARVRVRVRVKVRVSVRVGVR